MFHFSLSIQVSGVQHYNLTSIYYFPISSKVTGLAILFYLILLLDFLHV